MKSRQDGQVASARMAPVLNVPNTLSVFRIASVPALLWLAWLDRPLPFLVLLVVALLSDSLDGFLARRLRQTTELGARLDSIGDAVLYVAVPIGAWWLWPEIVRRELAFFVLAVASYVVPLAIGYTKFGRLPSYHTWSAKVTSVVMAGSFLVLLVFDAPLPFRCAAVLQTLVACEHAAITHRLPAWRCNVRSLWHATRPDGDHG